MKRSIKRPLALVLSAIPVAALFLATANPALAQAASLTADSPAAAPAVLSAQGRSAFETLDLFVGLDGSKQPQDLGINANMGVRFAANAGIPVIERAGFGAQVGVAMNLSDAAVHVLDQIEGTSRRTQTFATVGVFQHDLGRLSWSLNYDFLHERYYDTFNLGQVRAQAGWGISRHSEVGAWFTTPAQSDTGLMGETAVRLDPIGQVNGYFSHVWASSAQTTLWAGVATHHHDIVWVLPANLRDNSVVVYGARLVLPLNEKLAITGSGNFLTPAATGTVDAYLGVTFYPGASKNGRPRFVAPTAVANNPEFAVDLSR